MKATPTCPGCGKALVANAPKGLCQECLLKAALLSDSGIGGKRSRFTPPAIEELAAKFPQLQILELVGAGGMGAVYRARQRELDRIVALKVLPPDIGQQPGFPERFAREARALARLNHPGIVTIYDFGRANGLFFFLMEFVDGTSLRQILQSGRLSSREALAIVPQICDSLQYAHDQGIVHRDIKPENILIDRRGQVKVADFGLAKILGGPEEGETPGTGNDPDLAGCSTECTTAGKVMGTPGYMAPEQVSQPSEVDHRADIYALGVVLYQMLTGELPEKPLSPPSKKVLVDVRLDAVVLRALEQNPELRYQQASALKTQVETIATTLAGPADCGTHAAPPLGAAPPVVQMHSSSGSHPPLLRQSAITALVLLPPISFLWFLIFGHRAVGVDIDADVQLWLGLIGFPASAGLGFLLGWAAQIVFPCAADNSPKSMWPWSAILSSALLVLSWPFGGGLAVLLQLAAADTNGWHPSNGEFLFVAVVFSAAILMIAGATFLGIMGIRRTSKGSFSSQWSVVSATFWPAVVAIMVLVWGLSPGPGRSAPRTLVASAAANELAQNLEQVRQAKMTMRATTPGTDSAATVTNPASPFTVLGSVSDVAGTPIPGVEIRAACGFGTLRVTGVTHTDATGRFLLRFGPGLHRKRSPQSPLGVGFQAATIYATKPGWFETNLCRQGNLAITDEPGPSPLSQHFLAVLLPGEPHKLHFVFASAASLSGVLKDEKGDILTSRHLSLGSSELPPSSSVLSATTTDSSGRFEFHDLPTDRSLWFVLRSHGANGEVQSLPFTLAEPVPYSVELTSRARSLLLSGPSVDWDQSNEDVAASPESARVPPVVTASLPPSGAAQVDPALREIRITFSQSMQIEHRSWAEWSLKHGLPLNGQPYALDRGRTWVLPVKLEPGRVYSLWLNGPEGGAFKAADGQLAVPYLIIFETRN